MKKIFLVSGTRPEAIKLFPVYKQLEKIRSFDVRWISTGQHREMLKPILSFFDISPYKDLALMKPNQGLIDITAHILTSMNELLKIEKPDCVVVQGDTMTAMAVALVAFNLKIKIAHVEAGLRSYDHYSPFPEEANRRIISVLADFHFAPTIQSSRNLKAERVPGKIFITGNTVIDALKLTVRKVKRKNNQKYRVLDKYISAYDGLILITGHRRESFGPGFQSICRAIRKLAMTYPTYSFLYPVHLNPNVREPVFKVLKSVNNVFLIDPVPYDQMVYLMLQCKLVLTDSGGIQEEAPSLGKPVLVMRNTTERPEGIKAGCAKLVGVSERKIINAVKTLIEDSKTHQTFAKAKNPYGDGTSAKQIVDYLKKFLR